MAEKIADTRQSASRHWLRRGLVVAAIVIAAGTCILTTYLVFPEVALSRGLAHETYGGIEGLRLGMRDLEERHAKNAGKGGGGTGPIPIDLNRRYLLITVPFVRGDDNPEAQSMCWAVLDTEREEFVGSLRIPKTSDKFLGMSLKSNAEDRVPHISESGVISWSITCRGTLPAWWPARKPAGQDRTITRSSGVSFVTSSQSWTPTPSDLDRSDASRRGRLQTRMNRSLALPESDDELVAEHEWREGTPRMLFRRLIRRSRGDGAIRWTIGPEQFSSPDFQEDTMQIQLPPCELDRPIEWCVLVESPLTSRAMLNSVFWKLDLTKGQVSKLEIPVESTPQNAEVASDAQTVIFIDDGSVRYKYPGGGGSGRKVREGNNAELTAWHPEQGLRTLYQWWNSSDYLVMLSRQRVFLSANRGRDTTLYIHIIPLDGSPPRQLYP